MCDDARESDCDAASNAAESESSSNTDGSDLSCYFSLHPFCQSAQTKMALVLTGLDPSIADRDPEWIADFARILLSMLDKLPYREWRYELLLILIDRVDGNVLDQDDVMDDMVDQIIECFDELSINALICREGAAKEQHAYETRLWGKTNGQLELPQMEQQSVNTALDTSGHDRASLVCNVTTLMSIFASDTLIFERLCQGLQSLRESPFPELERLSCEWTDVFCEVQDGVARRLRKKLQAESSTDLCWIIASGSLQSQLGYFRSWLKARVLSDFYSSQRDWCQGTANLTFSTLVGLERWHEARRLMNSRTRAFKRDPGDFAKDYLQSDLDGLAGLLRRGPKTGQQHFAVYVEFDMWLRHPRDERGIQLGDKPVITARSRKPKISKARSGSRGPVSESRPNGRQSRGSKECDQIGRCEDGLDAVGTSAKAAEDSSVSQNLEAGAAKQMNVPNDDIIESSSAVQNDDPCDPHHGYSSAGGHVFVIACDLAQSSYVVFSSWRDIYSLKKWVSGNHGKTFGKDAMLEWISKFVALLKCDTWEHTHWEQLDSLFACPHVFTSNSGEIASADGSPVVETELACHSSPLPPWANHWDETCQAWSAQCKCQKHSPGEAWNGKLRKRCKDLLSGTQEDKTETKTGNQHCEKDSCSEAPEDKSEKKTGGDPREDENDDSTTNPPPEEVHTTLPPVDFFGDADHGAPHTNNKEPDHVEPLPVVWEMHYTAKQIDGPCHDSWHRNFSEIVALSRQAHDKAVDLVEALSDKEMGRVHRTHVLGLGSTKYGLLCPEPLLVPLSHPGATAEPELQSDFVSPVASVTGFEPIQAC